MTPTLMTSTENTAAARGDAEKGGESGAHTAHGQNAGVFIVKRRAPPILEEMLPPICSAAPSRPEEPPNRWVITVLIKINGAVRSRMGWPLRTANNTELVPWSFCRPLT